MKIYSVSFIEPITHEYKDEVFNRDTNKWEEVTVTVKKDYFTFYSLTPAKRLIKANLDKYKGSSITKVYANGDWVNCGEIKISGSNKHFIANTRMTKVNY